MITVYNAMLVLLGALAAMVAVLIVMPAYRRRIERFTTERIKRALPLTELEIRADKDRLRAEYALEVHKLEMKLEEATLGSARQVVEINRRDAKVNELEQALASQKTNVEEHLNARRVLEQTILDRLPKVESRLNDARRMLQQRDAEIAQLASTSARQTEALEQATQINVQLTQEVDRLRAALETRAARNRETIGDPRFDGEVALRTEIEALRAKTRDQAQLIETLQNAAASGTAQPATEAAFAEVETLREALAKAEAQLLSLQADTSASELIAALQRQISDQKGEMARLKATLDTYETYDDGARPSNTGMNDALAAKAEIKALEAQADEQRRSIDSLRAELASANQRLARQTQHFRDEFRRLSVWRAAIASEAAGSGEDGAARPSLAERIAQPRIPRLEPDATIGDGAREARGGGAFLKAVNGGGEAAPDVAAAVTPAAAGSAAAPRRQRLLDRISSLEK